MKLFPYLFIPLIFFTLYFFYTHTATSNDKPLLVVILMVKNEDAVMEATLKPFFDAGVQHYVVLDTGSTDQTVATTLQLFEKYNIKHGHVCQKPFVDFSSSRNHALECAEEIFPDAVFFFMIDAEWYMHNVESLLTFCDSERNSKETTYMCKISNNLFTIYLNRLFRAHTGVEFIGKVHECPNRISCSKIPDAYVLYQPSENGRGKTNQRMYRDRDVLLQEHQNDPTNPRTVFFLAQTYECLQDYPQACAWYHKRCAMSGGIETDFIAHYKLAGCYTASNNWKQGLKHYLKAFSMCPQKIEPLVQIAHHYMKTGNWPIVYLFAKHATKIPLPQQETIFIETIFYHLTRYELLSLASWHVGEHEIGKQATLQALKYISESNYQKSSASLFSPEELQNNLAAFQAKLDQQSLKGNS